ncbi:hypothetical protein [Jannaschia sp. R86511]|uniref:hypothetical protein n=1 Tax=Jannaschia sp. R86511 TaxID=3093853 RepID=UPI0036D3BA68
MSPLRQAVPGPGRWAGAVVTALLVAGMGTIGGIGPERSALLGAAAAVVVLTVRLDGDDPPWPQPAARRTRPGWHGVATTLRQLEGARTDAGDRAALRARLARLEADGPDPAAAAVRAVVPGIADREAHGPVRARPPTDRIDPTDPTVPTTTPTTPRSRP